MPARNKAAAPAPSASHPSSRCLGARLRGAREQAGLSVRGLARAIDVSPSLISQIEHGKVTPSVGTIYALANELGLSVDSLFRDAEAPGALKQPTVVKRRASMPPVSDGQMQRRQGRKAIKLASGVRWERLTPHPDPDLEFLYVVYDVGGESCPPDALIRHGGQEYAYVLSGRLGLLVGFEEYDLGPGDSIVFDAQKPHRLWAIGTKPAEAVWVVLNRHADARAKAPASRSRTAR